MNCNVVIWASFLGSGVKSYTPAFIVYWHVIALQLFVLWISERTRIRANGPVRVFLLLMQICAPGRDLRTWCRSAHLVKICAPGRDLRTRCRSAHLVKICAPGRDLRTRCRSAHLVKICAPGTLYNAVLAGLLFVGIVCCFFCFQCFISLLHSNSGYDWPVRTARILIGLFAPYWLIIPAIAVQKAYKALKTNKTVFK